MTHRIDRLEAVDPIERVPDPSSRRTSPVALTEQGRHQAETLARSLAEVDEDSMRVLSDAERDQLDQLPAKLLEGLDA
ncbi:MAG: hypothetical protein KDB24_03225 [Microthrixaceae bacterium]|nr:hypothetical protein [Microthrixaceae bacterium]